MQPWEAATAFFAILAIVGWGNVWYHVSRPAVAANVHPLSATLTGRGSMDVGDAEAVARLDRHLIERALAELDDGDIDGCKQALTRLLRSL